MNAIKHKNRIADRLRSRCGSSMLYAMVLMMICVIIASVVITAGSAAAGRVVTTSSMDARYYSVDSAVELVKSIVDGNGYTAEISQELTETGHYKIVVDSAGNILPLNAEGIVVTQKTDAEGKKIETYNKVEAAEDTVNHITATTYETITSVYEMTDGSYYAAEDFQYRTGDILKDATLDLLLGADRTAYTNKAEYSSLDMEQKAEQYAADRLDALANSENNLFSGSGTASTIEYYITVSGSSKDRYDADDLQVKLTCTLSENGNLTIVIASLPADGATDRGVYSVQLEFTAFLTVNENTNEKCLESTEESMNGDTIQCPVDQSTGNVTYYEPFIRNTVRRCTLTTSWVYSGMKTLSGVSGSSNG